MARARTKGAIRVRETCDKVRAACGKACGHHAIHHAIIVRCACDKRATGVGCLYRCAVCT